MTYQSVEFGIGRIIGMFLSYLIGKLGKVFVQRLTRTYVVANFRVPRRTRSQLALFEHQCQQRKQRMPIYLLFY